MQRSFWRRLIGVVMLGACLSGTLQPAQAQTTQPGDPSGFKQNAGAPQEFAAMSLPDMRQAGQRSGYALLKVQPRQDQQGWVWSEQVAIDRSAQVAISLIAPNSQAWRVEISLPDGSRGALAELSKQSGGQQQRTELGLGERGYPAEVYTVLKAPPGLWQITVTASSEADQGFILVAPESTYGLYSYLATPTLLEGQPISLAAYVYARALPPELPADKEDTEEPAPLLDGQELSAQQLERELELRKQAEELARQQEAAELAAKQRGEEQKDTPEPLPQEAPPAALLIPEALAEAKIEGRLVLGTPDGAQLSLPLAERGDPKQDAGVVSVRLPELKAGTYTAQLQIRATLPDGTVFDRTSEQIIPVLRPALALTERVSSQVLDDTRLALTFGAEALDALPSEVYVYAQVWGRGRGGELAPAGWVGGLAAPALQDDGRIQLTLTLDARWLALAGVQAPLELREARLQDSETAVPISILPKAAVEGQELPKAAFSDPKTVDLADPSLHQGRPPAVSTRTAQTRAPASGAQPGGLHLAAFHGEPRRARGQAAPRQQVGGDGILLVHGYCSGPVWPAAQFDDGPTAVFADFNQNRSHHTFAELIRDQGNLAFSDSFAVVAHSQGGAAALEMYTHYWTKLDNSLAPRRIQSLGTPYQGSQLAGVLALIGQIFGFGCGVNMNLTVPGSLLWLSTIPIWARNEVYYSTTAHGRWWIFELFCHATSFILPGIDDGVVAVAFAQLPGGHNQGTTRKQCHTGGMAYGAQYNDSGRNALMDIYGRFSRDVGVIPDGPSCPGGASPLTISMDDEDYQNANSRGGWIGATTSTNNTTFRFCRVPGTLFRPLSPFSAPNNHYAVLQLGTVCPNGSVPFSRYFDNEDYSNANWFAGNILPNSSDQNTLLRFCLFRAGWSTMASFPNLGIRYGVFAADGFSKALATGFVHTDDEDHNNANSYSAGVSWWNDAQAIVVGGKNTTLRMARVQ